MNQRPRDRPSTYTPLSFPPVVVKQLSRRLSRRPKRNPQAQKSFESEKSEEAEEYPPYRNAGDRHQLDARTDHMIRESTELQRSLAGWGAETGQLRTAAEMAAKEHARSTGLRALLRSEPKRQLHARLEHDAVKSIHRISLASSERTLEDTFLAGRLTLEEYEKSLEYLEHDHRLVESPSSPRRTSFYVERRSPVLSVRSGPCRGSPTSSVSSLQESLGTRSDPTPHGTRTTAGKARRSSMAQYRIPEEQERRSFRIVNPSPPPSDDES